MNLSLPSLREKSKALYRESKEELDKFPAPPPSNAVAELLKLVTNFSYDVSHLVKGADSFEQLLQRCRPAYAQLKEKIWSTVPDYRPFENQNDAKYNNCDKHLFIEEGQYSPQVIASSPVYLPEIRHTIET